MTMKLFVKPSCNSSRKARAYLVGNGITHEYLRLHHEGIKEEDVKQILSLTDNGVEDIVKKSEFEFFEDKTVNQFVQAVVEEPTILKTPIMVSSGKLVIGYNEEEIRLFMTREQKKKERELLYAATR